MYMMYYRERSRKFKVREKSGKFGIGKVKLQLCGKSGKFDKGQGKLALLAVNELMLT